MGINIRQKGQSGEREIADALNYIIYTETKTAGYEPVTYSVVQRNQNQSAVGGNDLSNTFGISIEIKRQESLSVNTWWQQCEAAAKKNDEVPVLLFRQNGKKWRCVLMGWLALPASGATPETDAAMLTRVQCEISYEAFLEWFRQHVRRRLAQGEIPHV